MKIWFQNRRTKWKKQENISNAEAAELMKAKKENQLSGGGGNLKAAAGKPLPVSADNNNGAASPNMTENGLNALLSKLSPAARSSPLPPPTIPSAIPPLMPSNSTPTQPSNQGRIYIKTQDSKICPVSV